MNNFDHMCLTARQAFDLVDGETITSAPFGTGSLRVVLRKVRGDAKIQLEHIDRDKAHVVYIDTVDQAYLIAAALIEAADAVSQYYDILTERMRAYAHGDPTQPLTKPEERLEPASPEPEAKFEPGATIYRQTSGDGKFRTIETLISDGILKPNGPAVHVSRTIAGTDAPIERVWMALTEDPPLKAGQPPRHKISWGDTAEEAMRFAKAGRKEL